MLKKLNNSYLLDGKLLIAKKEFIGFDPYISPGFTFNSAGEGTKIKKEEFSLNYYQFTVILMHYLQYGPGTVRSWIEVLRAGKTIIRFETGGSSLGYSYSKGDRFKIENGNAYYLARSYELIDPETGLVYSGLDKDQYYLLWFKAFSIPTICTTEHADHSNLEGTRFTEEEIEPFRQTEWKADAEFNGKQLQFSFSSIPGFFIKQKGKDGSLEYERSNFHPILEKLEVVEL